MTTIEGSVQAGFEGVRDAFAHNFEEHGESGAAVAVYVDGTKVVDLWGGVADVKTGRPYTDDTLQLVYSTTKGATAVVANLLAERGELDMDSAVAEYWPEFAANGKQDILVRWLLSHQAGLYAVDDALIADTDFLTWDRVIDGLAAQAPLWEPGTRHGYHGVTYGVLVGELVRRVTGMSLGTFFQQEVAAPLGLDFWIGLPRSEYPRVAPLVPAAPPDDPAIRAMTEQLMGPSTPFGRAMFFGSAAYEHANFADSIDFDNSAEFLSVEMPAISGVTNARSLARLYASLIGEVDGVRTLSEETIKKATENQVDGGDAVIFELDTRFGLGFMLPGALAPFTSPHAFGHAGLGGSVGFADPDAGVAFGYAMNQMRDNLEPDPRTQALIEASYKAI